MRLALKFVLAFAIGNILLAAVYGYLAVRREVRLFRHTASVEAESLGRALEDMLADAWRRGGHEGVLQVVRKVNDRQERELRVRWVWFDAQPGDPDFPAVSPERLTTVTIEQHEAVEALDADGTPRLDVYWPVALGAERRGGLEFAHAMTELQDNQRETVQRTALLIGGMALLSGLLAAALGVRLVGQPLRALMEKTRLISAGNLQSPIHLGTRDELAELGESLNRMCDTLAESQGKIREETAARIAAMEQLRHADRLKTVGRMASGIAHELGTPLSVVSGRAGLIGSGKLTADEVAQSAAAIKAESDKMTKIIRQLLDFARRKHAAQDGGRSAAGGLADGRLASPLGGEAEGRVAAGRRRRSGRRRDRRGTDPASADEFDRQRGRGDARRGQGGHRRPQSGRLPSRRRRRPAGGVLRRRGPRRGRGNRRGAHLAPLRAVLHHQGGRRRDRPGAVDRLRDRPGARRLDRRDQPAGRGKPLHRLLARGSEAVKARILIVDDERSMCDLLETDLRLRDYAPCCFTSAEEAFEAFCREDFEVVLTDLMMPGMDGIEFCSRLAANRPDVPVIVMTAFGSLETATAAICAGAYDFVTKPIELELLAATLRRAIERRQLQEQIRSLREAVERTARFEELLGESPVMQKLYDQLSQIADSDASVLIAGESGTGKELVARALHQRSRRRERPFVAVNCAALPDTLLESELFGHVKGAFTDARIDRKGLFLQAEGGTLLLDEIGEMPLAMQPKLLRALQENTVRPVGGEREVAFDAQNPRLDQPRPGDRRGGAAVSRGPLLSHQRDPSRVAAASRRGADALLLAQHFIAVCAARAKKQVLGMAQPVAEKLLAYSWPGNVRELRNVIERAVALTRFDQITVEDLPEKIRDYRTPQVILGGADPGELAPLEEIDRRYILHVLESVGGNRTLAARTLGLDRKTLYRKLRQYGALDADGE